MLRESVPYAISFISIALIDGSFKLPYRLISSPWGRFKALFWTTLSEVLVAKCYYDSGVDLCIIAICSAVLSSRLSVLLVERGLCGYWCYLGGSLSSSSSVVAVMECERRQLDGLRPVSAASSTMAPTLLSGVNKNVSSVEFLDWFAVDYGANSISFLSIRISLIF